MFFSSCLMCFFYFFTKKDALRSKLPSLAPSTAFEVGKEEFCGGEEEGEEDYGGPEGASVAEVGEKFFEVVAILGAGY